ncbi:putative membrane protein, partial [Ehrlichia ruminantium]
MEKFNSNLSIGIINTVLFLVFLSIITTLAHTIMLHRGLPIEHIEKRSIDNIQQQVGIFLPISSEELSKIDHKYNITDLTCNSISDIQDNILVIKQ